MDRNLERIRFRTHIKKWKSPPPTHPPKKVEHRVKPQITQNKATGHGTVVDLRDIFVDVICIIFHN